MSVNIYVAGADGVQADLNKGRENVLGKKNLGRLKMI